MLAYYIGVLHPRSASAYAIPVADRARFCQIEDYESGRKRGTDRVAPVPRVVELASEALALRGEMGK